MLHFLFLTDCSLKTKKLGEKRRSEKNMKRKKERNCFEAGDTT